MKDESQQQVPPGIVAFTHDGDIFHLYNSVKYEDWVKANLEAGHAIDTISVDGNKWSVEDKVANGLTIKRFVYHAQPGWQAVFEENSELYSQTVKILKKLPPSSLDRSGSQPGKEESSYPDKWENLDDFIKMIKVSVTHGYYDDVVYRISNEAEVKAELLRLRKNSYNLGRKEERELSKISQPSQPGEGKEDVLQAIINKHWTGKDINGLIIEKIAKEYAEIIVAPVRKQYDESWNKALEYYHELKSLPKEPSEEEINAAAKSECLRILGIHDPIGAGHKLFKAALQWLSSYKTKQLKS